MGPAIVSDAAFTKAISIILKTNSLHRRLVWSLVCFGPLRPDLDRFCAPTPRSIMPVHLHRSWIRPFQQEFRPPPPPHVPRNSWEAFRLLHPKVTSCHRGLNATVGAHLPQGKQTACRRRDPRTCTRHHAEVWEVTNYPLCECVFREAVRRHTVQTGRDTKLIAMLIEKIIKNKGPHQVHLNRHKHTLAHYYALQTHTHKDEAADRVAPY